MQLGPGEVDEVPNTDAHASLYAGRRFGDGLQTYGEAGLPEEVHRHLDLTLNAGLSSDLAGDLRSDVFLECGLSPQIAHQTEFERGTTVELQVGGEFDQGRSLGLGPVGRHAGIRGEERIVKSYSRHLGASMQELSARATLAR